MIDISDQTTDSQVTLLGPRVQENDNKFKIEHNFINEDSFMWSQKVFIEPKFL